MNRPGEYTFDADVTPRQVADLVHKARQIIVGGRLTFDGKSTYAEYFEPAYIVMSLSLFETLQVHPEANNYMDFYYGGWAVRFLGLPIVAPARQRNDNQLWMQVV